MKTKYIVGMFVIITLFSGCAIVDVTKTAKGYYEPTNPNDIEILHFFPNLPFIELGTIVASRFSVTQTAIMHNALRNKASMLGADAVIIIASGFISSERIWVTGVAIRYE